MDVESVYLIVGVVAFSAMILLVIDHLFKNKSYEEAVAEQRKQNSALYSDQQRQKPKEKKQKKANKKMKEKKSAKDGGDSVEESEAHVSDSNNENSKHHVEFTEPTVIQEDAVKETTTKRRQKREAVRPILVNRDSSAENIQPDVETLPANHFEELHPKDDFELLNAHLKEEKECVLKEKSKNKQNIEQTDGQQSKPKKAAKQQQQQQQQTQPEEKRDVAVEPAVVPETATSVANAPPAPVKDKKKKKSELNAIQQLGDKHGVNVSILMPMVRKAELSREEVQTLIDMLLNKQQDAPAMVDEWTEGKADPVQKLKKQVADKEKQVLELQEALANQQAKLREVRAEQTAERASLQANLRDLQETLSRNNAERQGYDNKYQALSIQLGQMQDEKKKMVEDFANMQMHIAKEETTIAQLNRKLQEQQEMLNQLTNRQQKLQEDSDKKEFKIIEVMEMNNALLKDKEDAKMTNSKLMMQLQNFEQHKNQELMALCMQKEECDRMIAQLRAEVNSFEEERARLNGLAMTLRSEGDKANDSVAALTSQLGSLKREWEEERGRLEGEVGSLRLKLDGEKARMEQERAQLEAKLEEVEGERNRIGVELRRFEGENSKLLGEKVAAEEEAVRLRAEKAQLGEEVAKLREDKVKLGEEKKVLLDASHGSDEQRQLQLNNLNGQLADAKRQLQQLQVAHDAKIDELRLQLQREIDEQRSKNDGARCEERAAARKFVERLFPEVKKLSGLPLDKWQEGVAAAVRVRLDRKPEVGGDVAKLQLEVKHYKKLIDETESMLSLLQKHVETEETRWRQELRSKENLIEELNADTKFREELREVSKELREAEEAKRRLMEECELNKKLATDALATSQKQTEEIKRLQAELEARQHGDVNDVATPPEVPTKVFANHSTNGPTASVPTDQTLSTASSAASSITEVSVKKNKKKKKKNAGGK